MARARNIKPAFFNNDLLAEIEPLGRLFFIGLWTISDYRGCLEWRPKRLKAQLLPYDNCDVETIGINLDKSGFIRFYSVQGQTFAKIVNFDKHQNPHKNEKSKGSDIPNFEEKYAVTQSEKGVRIKSDNIAINPDNNGSDPADSLLLIPDSPILIPETLCASKEIVQQAAPCTFENDFDYFWQNSGLKKLNKKAAKPAFKKTMKLLKLTSLELADKLILDCQNRLTAMQQGFDMIHPTTYLNGQRWEDEIVINQTQPRFASQQQPLIDNTDLSWMENKTFEEKYCDKN